MADLTKFRDEYVEMGYRLALLGLTDEEMAGVMRVTRRTFSSWKRRNKMFAEAIKNGKVIADSKVAEAMYRRAIGYERPDTVVTTYKGEITKTSITRHEAPDVKAGVHWLTNRQPEYWRNSQDASAKVSISIDKIERVIVDPGGGKPDRRKKSQTETIIDPDRKSLPAPT